MAVFKYLEKDIVADSFSKTIYCLLLVLVNSTFVHAEYPTSEEVSCEQDALQEKGFREIIQQRYKNLVSVCKNQEKPSPEMLSKCKHTIIWRKQEKIAMCPVYKSGTTSWIQHLIDLSFAKKETKKEAKMILKNGGDRKTTIDTLSKYESPSEWDKYTRSVGVKGVPHNMTGFIVVRHPFERLVSTYRDKLESYSRSFFENLARRVVEKYRERAIEQFGEDRFNEIRNFRDRIPKLYNSQNPKFEKFDDNPMLPTFWEFVQYIIYDYKKIDDEDVYSHVRPIHEHCCLCDENYQKIFKYILKSEEMSTEELNFIKSMPGWEAKIDLKQPKLNVQRPRHISSEDIAKMYFTQLSRDDVIRLYGLYELDFLLFNYTLKFENMTS